MTALSPLTRRIVAVGLLVLAVLLALQLIVVPLVTGIADRREDLGNLRARAARLEASQHRLLPDASTMPPGLAIRAPTRPLAEARLRALLAGSAAIAGVSLSATPSPTLSDGPDLRVLITANGPEGAVVAFASLVEHGSPLIRFDNWQLQAGSAPDRKLAFRATAIAVWDRQR